MSIKEKIEKELQELVDETGGCEEDLKNEKLQIKQTLSFILLALKAELTGWLRAELPFKDDAEMIAAINKLCEEK